MLAGRKRLQDNRVGRERGHSYTRPCPERRLSRDQRLTVDQQLIVGGPGKRVVRVSSAPGVCIKVGFHAAWPLELHVMVALSVSLHPFDTGRPVLTRFRFDPDTALGGSRSTPNGLVSVWEA